MSKFEEINSSVIKAGKLAHDEFESKSRIYHGSIYPVNPKEGDLWFQPAGDKLEIRVYENGIWNDRVNH